MNNIIKNTLLFSTVLVSSLGFSQEDESERKDRWKTVFGISNIRLPEDGSSIAERSFLRSTYQLNDRFSVSGAVAVTHFSAKDTTVANFSPAIHYHDDKTRVSFGFSNNNNQTFLQAKRDLNENGWSLLGRIQNRTRRGPQTKFIPDIPESFNVDPSNLATLATVQKDLILYKKNKFEMDLGLGIGGRYSKRDDFRMAYKALLAVKYGDFTFEGGYRPGAGPGFRQRWRFLARFNLKH